MNLLRNDKASMAKDRARMAAKWSAHIRREHERLRQRPNVAVRAVKAVSSFMRALLGLKRGKRRRRYKGKGICGVTYNGGRTWKDWPPRSYGTGRKER